MLRLESMSDSAASKEAVEKAAVAEKEVIEGASLQLQGTNGPSCNKKKMGVD